MKIELLMRSLDQEFPDRIENIKSSQVKWKDRWQQPFPAPPYRDRGTFQDYKREIRKKRKDLTNDIILRKEEFGGVLYDMLSKAVFSLDVDAYKAIELLNSNIAFNNLSHHMEVTQDGLDLLRQSLRKFYLCKI